MKPQDISTYEQRLDALAAIGDVLAHQVTLEAQAHFGRYLAIVSSGYIETSIQTILYEYSMERSDPAIAQFVEDRLSRELSLNVPKIESILKKFDSRWIDQINRSTQPEWREAVNSLKSLRDTFSHGRQDGTSYGTIRGYQFHARRYIAVVCEVILP